MIKHDKNSVFRFAPLSSPYAQKLLGAQQNIMGTNSVIYVKGHQFYLRSEATLNILHDMGWPWKAAYLFKLIPVFLRDFLYDAIAKRRYKWFGKKETCMLPSEEVASRFMKEGQPLN